MNYKFTVTYLPFESEGVPSQTVIEVTHVDNLEIDQIKQNIIWAFHADGCKVITIEGGAVE